MGKLIDADVFVENIVSIADLRTISTKTIGEALDKTPTVDAVPVVRCAVCRYFWCNMRGGGILPNGVCVLGRGGYDPMDFCSEGERKDGEQND